MKNGGRFTKKNKYKSGQEKSLEIIFMYLTFPPLDGVMLMTNNQRVGYQNWHNCSSCRSSDINSSKIGCGGKNHIILCEF